MGKWVNIKAFSKTPVVANMNFVRMRLPVQHTMILRSDWELAQLSTLNRPKRMNSHTHQKPASLVPGYVASA
jgi:hypothetical protein